MSELWPIIASVLAVFLVMGLGAACRSAGWLTPQADESLASLVTNLMLPAYFVYQFSRSDRMDSLSDAWLAPTMGFALTTLGFALALGIARGLGPWIGLESDSKQRAFALSAGICNYGYIPLPLAEQFYPNAVIDLILHNVGVTLALWSVGILVINGASGGGLRKAIFSPPLLAVVFSIAVRQSGTQDWIPDSLMTAVGQLGNCAIPLGLLLSGAMIVDFLVGTERVADLRVITTAIGFRQCLMSAIILGSAVLFSTPRDLDVVLTLQAAMPAAVFPIVLVRLYGRDTATALQVVLWTSLAGIVMIPAWMAAGGWLLGF